LKWYLCIASRPILGFHYLENILSPVELKFQHKFLACFFMFFYNFVELIMLSQRLFSWKNTKQFRTFRNYYSFSVVYHKQMLGFLRIIIAIMLIWIICLYEINIWISFSLRFVNTYYSTLAFVFSKPCLAQWWESVTNLFLWSNIWLEVVLCCWCQICQIYPKMCTRHNLLINLGLSRNRKFSLPKCRKWTLWNTWETRTQIKFLIIRHAYAGHLKW